MTDVSNPFDITKCINNKSGRIDFSAHAKKPAFFVVNRVFSNTMDSLLYANEVNKFYINDDQMSFDFYYYGLPRKNRYGKYNKKQKDNDVEFLNAIMEIYDYSIDKAIEVYDVLKPNRKQIMEMVFKGGKQ